MSKKKSILNFYLQFSQFWEEKKQLWKKLGIFSDTDFNIFTSIAEYYWYENLHSDILKNILDPYTSVIGNSEFLKCFLEFIEVNPNLFNYKNASVERELERIDLLIYDEKSAIIIENKINFACDRPDQLPRYYKKITDSNGEYQKEVIKIVYLTLTNEKNPSFDYSDEYKGYLQDIQNRLIHISAVNIPNNKFAAKRTLSNTSNTKTSFLQELVDIETKGRNNYVALVYLQQYAQLLNYLGENEIMCNENEEIVRLMFKSDDSSKMAKDIVKIYNERYIYLGKVCLKEILYNNPEYEKINNDDDWIGKKISDNTFAFFSVEGKSIKKVYCYGFYNPNNNWTDKDKKKLIKKMKIPVGETDSMWVAKFISFRNLETEEKLKKLTVDKLKNYIKGLIDEISK